MDNRKPVVAKTNWYVDAAILTVFIVVLSPTLTGLAIHEWLSLAFTGAIIVHLLMHWQWIVSTTKRIRSRLTPQIRINYILNATLFVTMTIAIFSGLMISEVVLKFFGLSASRNSLWRGLHSLSTELALIVVGVHLALHWRWVVATWTQRGKGQSGAAIRYRAGMTLPDEQLSQSEQH